MSQLRFDGRVAVITGSSRGIGRAHARLLGARGASVVVNGTSASDVTDVVREVVREGGIAIGVVASISDPDGAREILSAAFDTFGHVDVIINNAGTFAPQPFERIPMPQFSAMLEVHYLGAVRLIRAAWPRMVRARYGRIVNTVSAAILGLPQMSDYAGAKGALFGLTRTLAVEGAPYGINVNAVAPAAMTDQTSRGPHSVPRTEKSFGVNLISPAVAFLAHETCRVTGELFRVAGGNVSRLGVVRFPGYSNPALSPEDIVANLERILDTRDPVVVGAGEWLPYG